MDPELAPLIAASVTFVGTHFALSHPLRTALTNLFGPRGFLVVYSLVALASFGWMVVAFRATPDGGALWPGGGTVAWVVASVLTFFASVLLVGSFQSNPALPDTRAREHLAKGVHGVFHLTRHPMMWSFALWAAAHIIIAPTPRVLVLSLTIAFLALAGAHLQDHKKAEQFGSAWDGWQARTSYWPRLERLAMAGPIPLIGGLILWLAATWAHIPTLLVPAGVWRWLVG